MIELFSLRPEAEGFGAFIVPRETAKGETMMKVKGRIGRPLKRGSEPLGVTSVRIEEKVKTALVKEFGGLSDAIYYLYQGVQEFRESRGLPTDRDFEPEETLKREELETLLYTVRFYLELNKIEDGRKLKRFRLLAKKLNDYLYFER